MLGVAPATLRRWTDEGRISAFTTPGGHRRFPRAALERLLPYERPARAGAAGVTTARVARAYRRRSREVTAGMPWLTVLTDAQRTLFREHGRRLAGALLAFLEAGDEDGSEQRLAEAAAEAEEYGRVAASLRLSLSQAVEGFLRFRSPFIHELALAARRRGFDATETSSLLEAAEQAMDRLLIATMTGHGSSRNGAQQGGAGIAG